MANDWTEFAKTFGPATAVALIVMYWGGMYIKSLGRKLGEVEKARVDDLKGVVENNTKALTQMTTVMERCQRK